MSLGTRRIAICSIQGSSPWSSVCQAARLNLSPFKSRKLRLSHRTAKHLTRWLRLRAPGPQYALKLPVNFDRRTGDWDEIKKSGVLRLLVLYNKTGFFYDKGRPRGMVPDIAEELEVYLNKKLKTGAKKLKVVFIPVTPAQIEKDLNDGYGDIIAMVVAVTPEREKKLDFSIPIISNLKLVAVQKKAEPQISSVDDLSGKEIYVNKVSLAYELLREQNEKFKQAGKPEIVVKESDPNLTEEDLLEMTNAGIIPATVAYDYRADLWSTVLSNIVIDKNVVPMNVDNVAWAMRKNSPQLKALIDEFLQTHRQGTLFGRVMFSKYIANKKFIKNATSEAEIKRFKSYVEYFKQYGASTTLTT